MIFLCPAAPSFFNSAKAGETVASNCITIDAEIYGLSLIHISKKYYQALVWGHLERDNGEINLPMICDWENRPRQRIDFVFGKRAVTFYEVLERLPTNCTRVKLTPITGRSHQLRLHTLALGHPILGDKFYSHPQAKSMSPRLCLHAEELTITHPITGEKMTFKAKAEF